jgi:hypothetical protein
VLAVGHLPVILTILATGSEGADAGPRAVEVQLEGVEGCPGARAFLESLRSRTEQVRDAEKDEPRTVIQVRLGREHGQVIGELRVTDDHGQSDTRKVQGRSCNDVVQALSLTAALVLDPTALLSVPATSAGSGEAPAKNSAEPSDDLGAKDRQTPTQPPTKPPTTETIGMPPVSPTMAAPGTEIGGVATGLVVLAGSFSPGIGLVARKAIGKNHTFHTVIGLGLSYVRNDVLQSPKNAELVLAAATATACPLHLTARFLTLSPCALVMAGWVSVAGRQFTSVNTVDQLWLSAGLTARAAASVGAGISFEVEGGFSLPMIERQFFVTSPGNVIERTPTISPIVSSGLTYAF